MPIPANEYKIYRSLYIPELSRPLVFITCVDYVISGFPIIRAECIVAHPDNPIKPKIVSIDKRYLPRDKDVALFFKTLQESALGQAEDTLEKIAGQGVVLEEIKPEELASYIHRSGWAERWREIYDFTHCDPLRSLLREFTESQLNRLIEWKDAAPRK